MAQTQMLHLSEPDVIKAGVLDIKLCLANAERVFQSLVKGDYLMGGPSEHEHSIRIAFPAAPRVPEMPTNEGGRTLQAMPAYIGGDFHAAGVKWFGSNLASPARGIPRGNHFILLSDIDTGIPYCFMVANLVSAMRSAAVPGLAARYLADKDAEVIGLIGAGVMNRPTLAALLLELPKIKEVKVFDLLADKCEAYCRELADEHGLDIHPVNSAAEAFIGSDIIHTAQSKSFRIEKSWLKENALLAVSSSVSIEEELLLNANLIMDHLKLHDIWREADPEADIPTFEVIDQIEKGRLSRSDITNFGDIISGKTPAIRQNGKPAIFYWMGMSVFDVALAEELYQNALKLGLGQKCMIWDKPYWV